MAQISIIVPVYKTEQYLERCITSILSQTFSDFELILVDDGSPDNCPKICDYFAQLDSRIKVVHKINAGVAAARNTGLSVATGEYNTFVDSDDWIEPDMYQRLMDKAKEYDCDVVMCDCIKDFPDHSEIYTHDIREGYYSYEQLEKEYYPHLLMMENVEYPATISNCLCLFRQSQRQAYSSRRTDANDTSREQHNEYCLRYIEGVRYSEDLLFGAQMMYQAKSFYYLKGEALYHYCMNPTSTTHTFRDDKWRDYTILYHAAEEFFLKKSGFDFRHQLDLMLLFFVYNAVGDLAGTSFIRNDIKINKIRDILYSPIVRDMFSRLKVYQLPISWKLKVYTYLYKYIIGLRVIVNR